ETRGGARLREIRLLGEEAVTGVNRLRAAPLRGVDHLLRVEVALARGRGADPHGLVALFDVQRALVCLRVDRDGAHAHLARRASDAAGDLAAVGDEQLVEHFARLLARCKGRAAYSSRTGIAHVDHAVRARLTCAPLRSTGRGWRRRYGMRGAGGGAGRAARWSISPSCARSGGASLPSVASAR